MVSKKFTHYVPKVFNVPEDDKAYEPATYASMLRYASLYDYILLIVGVVSSLLYGAFDPVNMIAFREIVNILVKAQTDYDNHAFNKTEFSHGIVKWSWIYFGIGWVIFISTFFGMSALYTLCERQVFQIRKAFLKAILNQDMDWFDKNEIGALTHKMTANIEKIKDGASDKISILLQAIGALTAGIGIAASQSWQMTLIVLIIIPFVILSLYGSARVAAAASYKESQTYSSAGAVAEEVISGIRTVASFNAQYFELNRYKQHLLSGKAIGLQKAKFIGIFSGCYQFFMFAAMGISFLYGTMLVIWKIYPPGTVFSVFWAAMIGAIRMGFALPQISIILGAKAAAGELFSIIDRKPALDITSTSGQKIPELKGQIRFQNIHFHYASRPEIKILNGISFEVNRGETIALIGHSGCGKSTIISLLMRYYQHTKGSITIDDIPIEDLNIQWLRSVIGIVSQEPVLFHGTIAENILMGTDGVSQTEVEQASRNANAHEFIMKLPQGYDTLIGADGGQKLSGGQKQRIAIARALIRNPKILILDEATSALDMESEKLVQEALEKASQGRTTICIAHRLATIKNAHKIIVFNQGAIVETGTHDQLIQNENGSYYQMVVAQRIEGQILENEANDDKINETKEFKKAASIRASNRLRKSLVSARSVDIGIYMEDTMDKLQEMETKEASFMDILRYLKPQGKLIIAGLILSLIRGSSWPIFSILYGCLFLILSDDDLSHARSAAILICIAFIVIGIIGGIATFASGYCLGIVGERVALKLRLDVFRSILRQDGAYFDKPSHSVGELTSRLTQDPNGFRAAIDQRLAEILQGLTTLIFGIIIAFAFGWNMALFCIFIAILVVIIQTAISSYLKYRGTQDAVIATEAAKVVTEAIENVRTIQALTKQDQIYQKFCKTSELPHRKAIIKGLIHSAGYAVAMSYVSFNFFASYLFGMWLVNSGHAKPFVVFQVIEALNMAVILISTSANYFPEYIKARISASLMFRMIRYQPNIDNLSEGGSVMPIQGDVKIKNIKFAYPNGQKYLASNNLSLSAKFGTTVAIVGPSGCGKSTIIQLLERFYDVLSGSILIDDQDIKTLNIRHLRSSMALVGQEPTLFNLSIRENITYGMENVPDEEVIKAAKLANIHDLVVSLPEGYQTSVGGRGTQLSAGQRQRIAIARAIIRQPKILLLDEATAALDGESEKIVQNALDKARNGRTCIIVANRLSTIQNADIICVIDNGKNVELGSHQTLLSQKGLYSKLVTSHSITE